MNRLALRLVIVSAACGAAASVAAAQARSVFAESEPNDSKAAANVFTLSPGDAILGNSTSGAGAGADYFRVKTTPMPLGVYRHRLVITSATPGHTGHIRGLSQSAGVINPTSDVPVQLTSVGTSPPRFLQSYGFGKEEEIYVRIQGTPGTTADYVATLSTDLVSFTDLPTVFYPGPITITTAGMGHNTDTDLWVYDGGFSPIVDFGNDNGAGLPNGWSTLTRTFPSPGFLEHVLALTSFNFANQLASPADDDRRTGMVLDFPNAVVNGLGPTTPLNLQFSITDSTGIPFVVPNTKNEPYDVNWFRFFVYPPGPTGACCLKLACADGRTLESCMSSGGSYQGDGTSCGPGVCEPPQPGACCQPNGTCAMTTLPECTGMFLGPSTSCTPNPCAQPTGACCAADGTCSVTTQAACAGAWHGEWTNCTPNNCPQPDVACCFADGSCQLLTAAACTSAGGSPGAAGSTCSPNTCPPPPADCNSNGISDTEDISSGFSQDCNNNGVPDECDIAGGTGPDCNANAIPDECDLAAGTSPDCNTNGVPDECDLGGAYPSAVLNTRVYNDFPGSTLSYLDNYPALIRMSDDNTSNPLPPPAFANLHIWHFSDDNLNPAQFNNGDGFTYFANLIISGTGGAEAGLLVNPWWSPVDGRLNVRIPDGEIAAFGPRLPFYSFTANHGISYAAGDTIGLSISYDPHSLSMADPGTIQYDVHYNGTDYTSGWIPFDEGNPNEDPPYGLWGILNDARVGGHYQPFLGTVGATTAEFTNIRALALPAENDCDGNGIPDDCDIAYGSSADCNSNGTLDDCDVAGGASRDSNGNGVPDECEGPCDTIADARAAAGGTGVRLCNVVVSSTTDLVYSPGSKNLHVQDATGGITVFGATAAIDALLGFPIAEGDRVTLEGTTGSFNGLLELVHGAAMPLSVIANNEFVGVPAALVVNAGDFLEGSATAEGFESRLVRLPCVTFLQTGTFAENTNYSVTDGAATVAVRVSTTELDLVGQPIPTVPVDITGIFTQFDSTDPRTGGYQLLPRHLTDLVPAACQGPEISPTATGVFAVGVMNQTSDVTLAGSPGNLPGATVRFRVMSAPGFGSLQDGVTPITIFPHVLSGAVVRYAPSAGATGLDSFDFDVWNGLGGADQRFSDAAEASVAVQRSGSVFLTEIMFNAGGGDFDPASPQSEYVELYNPGPGAVALGHLTDAARPSAPANLAADGNLFGISIAAHSALIVAHSHDVVAPIENAPFLCCWSLGGMAASVVFLGDTEGTGNPPHDWKGLNNTGDRVFLYDSSGGLLDLVAYDVNTPWPGDGFSYDGGSIAHFDNSGGAAMGSVLNDDGGFWGLHPLDEGTDLAGGRDSCAVERGSPLYVERLLTPASPPSPPTAFDGQAVAVSPDTFVDITLMAQSNPVGRPLNYVIESLPEQGQLSDAGGPITVTPHPLPAGSDVVRFTAPPGAEGTATFDFSVVDAISSVPSCETATQSVDFYTFASADGACLIISEVVDGTRVGGTPKFVEITNTGSQDFTFPAGGVIIQANASGDATIDVNLSGVLVPASDSLVIAGSQSGGQSVFESTYGFPADIYSGASFGNGDDRYFLTDTADSSRILDAYGEFGVSGYATAWEYTDSYAYRLPAFTSGQGLGFSPAQWVNGVPGALDGPTDADDLALLLANTTPGQHVFNAGCAPRGACCTGASCQEGIIASTCASSGGTYQGDASSCTPDPCGATGACCQPDFNCQLDVTEEQCTFLGGLSWQAGASCSACPQAPTGACCGSDGTCVDGITAQACADGDGSYRGDGSLCAGLDPPCAAASANLLITEIVDGNLFGGKPKWVEITNCGTSSADLAHYSLVRYNNGAALPSAFTFLTGTLAGGQSFIFEFDGPSGSRFQEVYGFPPDQMFAGPSINGNDAVALFIGSPDAGSNGLLDLYGVIGIDGTGQVWDYTDGYAYRKAGSLPSAVFDAQQWVFGGVDSLDGGNPNIEDDDLLALRTLTDPGAHDCCDPFAGPDCDSNGIGDACELAGNDCNANGVFDACETIVVQPASLNPSGLLASDEYGVAVAIDGDRAVVGARLGDSGVADAGAAYVFHRAGATWTFEQKLSASDPALNDEFGYAVAIQADRIVVGARLDDDQGGASGSAYVFRFQGGIWVQEQKLTASDGAVGDRFGDAVAINAGRILAAASQDDSPASDAGSAYVFLFNGTMWAQEQKLTAADELASDRFGFSVSLSGDTALIGATLRDEPGKADSGAAYVFRRSGTIWTFEAKLLSSDLAADDQLGRSVSLKGDLAVIGSHLDDDRGNASGSAYVFQRTGTSWTQEAKLIAASDGQAGDNFGFAVALDGQSILVGAHTDDDVASNAGSAYVFLRSGPSWVQQPKFTALDGTATAEFGRAVGLGGLAAVIGANLHNQPSSDAGASYIVSLGCVGGCTGTSDLDGDGDIDLGDWDDMVGCIAGPSGSLSAGCECADLHPSGSVDLKDTADFQAAIDGP